MDGDTTERLSQESQCPKDGFNGLLARASAFAGGVLSSIQALAGTTACKGVQIARLKDWAKENDCWIEDPESLVCSLTEVQRTRFIWPMMEYTFINLTTSVILTTTLLHSLNEFLPITNTFQIAPTISSVSHRIEMEKFVLSFANSLL